MKIPHPVQAREPPKVKKLKIGVARKLDLIEPNWVCSFSSLIRLYQTRIVSLMLVSMIFNLLDRDMKMTENGTKIPKRFLQKNGKGKLKPIFSELISINRKL
jgi:hypothetical protein